MENGGIGFVATEELEQRQPRRLVGHSALEIAKQVEEALDGDDLHVDESGASHLVLEVPGAVGEGWEGPPVAGSVAGVDDGHHPTEGFRVAHRVLGHGVAEQEEPTHGRGRDHPIGPQHPKCFGQGLAPILEGHQMEQGSHHHHGIGDRIRKGKLAGVPKMRPELRTAPACLPGHLDVERDRVDQIDLETSGGEPSRIGARATSDIDESAPGRQALGQDDLRSFELQCITPLEAAQFGASRGSGPS